MPTSTTFKGRSAVDVFFRNVQDLMRKKNISRAHLARILGTQPPAITRMFAEKENISIARIETIAKALDVPIQKLFQEKRKKVSA